MWPCTHSASLMSCNVHWWNFLGIKWRTEELQPYTCSTDSLTFRLSHSFIMVSTWPRYLQVWHRNCTEWSCAFTAAFGRRGRSAALSFCRHHTALTISWKVADFSPRQREHRTEFLCKISVKQVYANYAVCGRIWRFLSFFNLRETSRNKLSENVFQT